MFDAYLARWSLTVDGAPIRTTSSHLLPVIHRGTQAMLKIAASGEERRGNGLMKWWDGDGAAQVLAHDDAAILLERAQASPSLAELARTGRDDETMSIACEVIAKLHASRKAPPADVVSLEQWFASLRAAAGTHDDIYIHAALAAGELLSAPRDIVVLHGDMHHGNVLYFGERGWLAIDPKGLIGERGFDYANLFCNPDHGTATNPARFARRVDLVADLAGSDVRRLLQWILAWGGLSAIWMLEEGLSPSTPLEVARLALAALGDPASG